MNIKKTFLNILFSALFLFTIQTLKAQSDVSTHRLTPQYSLLETGDTLWWHLFTPEKTFTDFPAKFEAMTVRTPALNYSKCSYGSRFSSQISKGLLAPANFAGQYSFVEWSCGNDCQQSAIIDLYTGMVYEGPFSTRGFTFFIDSKIVVVNPATKEKQFDPRTPPPVQWLWNGSTFDSLQ